MGLLYRVTNNIQEDSVLMVLSPSKDPASSYTHHISDYMVILAF